MKSNIRLRNALTLIELMVVVVILTTLVAGVLPLVSPNNDARKIREASRGLQTYLMQAQAEAARLGRPVGVSFVESTPGSGVALEAYQVQVPIPYAGSSSYSRAQIQPYVRTTAYGSNQIYYGNDEVPGLANLGLLNGGTAFPRHFGKPLYVVQTIRLPNPINDDDRIVNPDAPPPGLMRVGDTFDLEGNLFLVVDELLEYNTKELNGVFDGQDQIVCIWLNQQGQQARKFFDDNTGGNPGDPYQYLLYRQPGGFRNVDGGAATESTRVGGSSVPPLQFPAGVALDLQASGIEPTGEPMMTIATQQDIVEQDLAGVGGGGVVALSSGLPRKQFSILFSPSGGVESVWINQEQRYDAGKIFLLLGRIENANVDFTKEDVADWKAMAEVSQGAQDEQSADELAERREQINWLNLDSRWVFVNANSGRLSVEETASQLPPPDDLVATDGEMNSIKGRLRQLGLESLREIFAEGDQGGDALTGEALKILLIEEAHALAHGGSSL